MRLASHNFANALSIPRRPVNAVTGCTNAVNAQQKLMKQIGSLVGAVSMQERLMKAGWFCKRSLLHVKAEW